VSGSSHSCPGPTFASSNEFRITIRARARTRPCRTTASTSAKSRARWCRHSRPSSRANMHPLDTGVISVTKIHAGEAVNVVPDDCVLEGTVRTFTEDVLEMIERRMRTIAESDLRGVSTRSANSSSAASTPRPSTTWSRPTLPRRVLADWSVRRTSSTSARRWAPRTQLLPASEAGLLLPDRQRRRRAPRRWPRPRVPACFTTRATTSTTT